MGTRIAIDVAGAGAGPEWGQDLIVAAPPVGHRGAMTSTTTPRIVCGLDDSEHAPAVLAWAKALSHRLALPLEAVHSPTPDIFTTGDERDADVRQGQDTLARILGLAGADEITIQPGPPAEVLRNAMDDGAVLGVVGSRGRGPLRAALLGSVSSELVEEASCPIVVVPPGAALPDLGASPAIVCRLDGSIDDRPTLDAAAWIADALGGAFTAVNVRAKLALRTGTTAMWVQHDLDELGVAPAVRVESGNAVDQIRQVAERHAAALIVVGWDGDALMPGAVAGKLAARSDVPVLVVPPRVRVQPGQMGSGTHVGAQLLRTDSADDPVPVHAG
jgi:nucleotide-binding universal stress UspA family protein